MIILHCFSFLTEPCCAILLFAILSMSLQKRLMKIVERNSKPRWRDLLEANDYLEHAFTLTPEQRTTITGVKRASVSPLYMCSIFTLLTYPTGNYSIEGADEAEQLVRQKPHWWRWRALKLIISFNRHLSRVSTSAEVSCPVL